MQITTHYLQAAMSVTGKKTSEHQWGLW